MHGRDVVRGSRRLLAARRTALLLATLVALAAAVAAPAVASADPVDVRTATDTLLFATPLNAFSRTRDAVDRDPRLDWSSDDCSVPMISEPQRSQPQGFDFRAACQRHDFGYRNDKAQGRFTEDVRQRIDDTFHADLDAVCGQYRGWMSFRGVYCRHIAGDYYFWVRSCGANPAPYCPLVARDFVVKYVR